MKKSFDEADQLDGFEELSSPDQDKVRKAWDDGHVADEDIPETARKEGDEDGEEEDEEEEKPKKAAGKKAADKGGKKEAKEPAKGVFKFEYAPSARAKCKGTSCL